MQVRHFTKNCYLFWMHWPFMEVTEQVFLHWFFCEKKSIMCSFNNITLQEPKRSTCIILRMWKIKLLTKSWYLGGERGREKSQGELSELKFFCCLCLLLIGKGFFPGKILKLINVGKWCFKESLVTDIK